jgi:hypothetical protein
MPPRLLGGEGPPGPPGASASTASKYTEAAENLQTDRQAHHQRMDGESEHIVLHTSWLHRSAGMQVEATLLLVLLVLFDLGLPA